MGASMCKISGAMGTCRGFSACSKNSIHYLDDLSVISHFPDSTLAWKEYKKLHLAEPTREYYIFHTDHNTIEVKEQKFIGVKKRLQ